MKNKVAINTHQSTTETKNNKQRSRKKTHKIKIGFIKVSVYNISSNINILSFYILIIMKKLIFKKLTIAITPKKGNT